MEKMNALTLIITLVVGVILTGALLGPVIGEATATEKTFTNPGVFNYGSFSEDGAYTMEYTKGDSSFTINTEETELALNVNSSVSVVASDNVLVRYGHDNSGYFCQIVGMREVGTEYYTTPDSFTVTLDDNLINIAFTTEGSTNTLKFEYTDMYALVPSESEAVLKVATDAVYIKGDSPLYASGLTNIASWHNIIHFEGNYTDGITITCPNLDNVTFDNITWNIEAVDGYIDLYKLTSVEFDAHYDGNTVHATYSYFAVPSEVTAELSNHLTPGQISLMSAIPVMVIMALLMVAIGAIALRRND